MSMSRRGRLMSVAILVLILMTLLSMGGPTARYASAGVTTTPTPAAALDSLPRTVTVTGIGTALGAPDVAEVRIGVETIDTNAAEAVSANTATMTDVMSALEDFDLPARDVQTVNYSVWVEQERDPEGQLTGTTRYHVINEVLVTLRDVDQIGEMLQAAVTAGANTVGGINFRVEDPTALEQQARDDALAKAQAKAEQLAEGLDLNLGAVRQVVEVTAGTPSPLFGMAAGIGGAEAAPVSGGTFAVSVQLQVTYDIAS
ncbi:MAG: SIMPL domain-containing protein [Anaerolineae bacterium]